MKRLQLLCRMVKAMLEVRRRAERAQLVRRTVADAEAFTTYHRKLMFAEERALHDAQRRLEAIRTELRWPRPRIMDLR